MTRLLKRLEDIERSLSPRYSSTVMLITEVGDSQEQIDDKIIRWRAGADVVGFRDFAGGGREDAQVIIIRLVSPKISA